MREVEVTIFGTLQVPDDADEDEIIEAIEFNIGLYGWMASDNSVGDYLDWVDGHVTVS